LLNQREFWGVRQHFGIFFNNAVLLWQITLFVKSKVLIDRYLQTCLLNTWQGFLAGTGACMAEFAGS
jgi:hypothetical protein